MNGVQSSSNVDVMALRNAALVLLDKSGIAEDANGNRCFEPVTAEDFRAALVGIAG